MTSENVKFVKPGHSSAAPGFANVLRGGREIGYVSQTGPDGSYRAELFGIGSGFGPTRTDAVHAAETGAVFATLTPAFLEFWEGTGAAQGSETDPDAIRAAEIIHARRGLRITAYPADRAALACMADYAESVCEILSAESHSASRSCVLSASRIRHAIGTLPSFATPGPDTECVTVAEVQPGDTVLTIPADDPMARWDGRHNLAPALTVARTRESADGMRDLIQSAFDSLRANRSKYVWIRRPAAPTTDGPAPIEHEFSRTAFNEVQCGRCLGLWVRHSPAEPAEALDGSWPTECPGTPRTHGPRDQGSPDYPAAEGCNCLMDSRPRGKSVIPPTVLSAVGAASAAPVKTHKGSTAAVERNLHTFTGMHREAWEGVWHADPAVFETWARRYLGDHSELRTVTLDRADWAGVHAHFAAIKARDEAPIRCAYSAAHALRGVPAVTVIDCGPVVGPVEACQQCADFYARMQGETPAAETPAEAEDERPTQATADAVIFGERRGQVYVLLIMRGWEPFKGCLALPGGYVDPGEVPEVAARRELAEETGLSIGALTSVGFYFAPGRDPRGRFVSSAFTARVVGTPLVTAGDDAAEARWVPVDVALAPDTRLAFDHQSIIRDALELVS